MGVTMEEKVVKRENKIIDGVIWKQLLLFAIPLLIGNLFQQLYNTVDSIIVGNYVGREALAAVGSSNSLINMLVGFFLGLSTGAGVVISQYYGAGKNKKLHDAIHTALGLIFCSGILLTILGILLSPGILKLMGTPDDVMESSVLYLRVYFCGILSVMFYNMGSGILRAIGDSKRPLYYLIIASLVNVVLDLLFVVVFHMGVMGVALATLIAQTISAVLVIRKLVQSKEVYRVILKDITIQKEYVKIIIKVGLPAGIQQSVISFSNVIVQSHINSFGSAAMAGCGAYTKIDGFAILPVMSFSLAITTFVGQNIGAGRYDRVRKSARVCLLMSLSVTLFFSVLLYTFGSNILEIFSKDPEVVLYGSSMLKTLAPFYVLLAISHIFSGVIRGSGQATVPMIIMVANMCILRIILLSTLMPIFNDIKVVFLGYIVTWSTCALAMFIYYKKGKWLAAFQKI